MSSQICKAFYLWWWTGVILNRPGGSAPWKSGENNVTLVLHILKAHYANEHQRRQHVGEIQSINFIVGLARVTRESNMDGCMSRVFGTGDRPIKAKTDPDPAGHTTHLICTAKKMNFRDG